jgi:acyl-CoA synthetase (NDP forming)
MEKLGYEETIKLLKKFNIPFLELSRAKTLSEAIDVAEKIGYPVAMKIYSPQISHKTDVGGVVLNIKNETALKREYNDMINTVRKKAPNAKIGGVIIQKMFSGNGVREVIIGSKYDKQFGPLMMFGLGGIFVEVLKDVSFRLIPIKREDAREMISEIKGYPILKGIRGWKPVNFEKLEECLLNVSKMVEKTPNIKELDINPLLINHKDACVADVRIFVD